MSEAEAPRKRIFRGTSWMRVPHITWEDGRSHWSPTWGRAYRQGERFKDLGIRLVEVLDLLEEKEKTSTKVLFS